MVVQFLIDWWDGLFYYFKGYCDFFIDKLYLIGGVIVDFLFDMLLESI